MELTAVAEDLELEPPGQQVIGRFRTRLRLLVAVGTLCAMLLVAVALQYTALRRIEHERADAEAMEERLLLAMELESALRRQFAHQPYAAAGHAKHAAAYHEARRGVVALTQTLSASLHDPEAARWVAAIEKATGDLERSSHARFTTADRGQPSQLATSEASALVFGIEQNIQRLFSMLGIATATHREAVIRGQDAVQRLAIGLVLGTALLTVLLTLYLSRSVAKPLARLELGVARMAGGDLATRIDIRTPDEFGAVASQLNEVAAHLQEHRERLSRVEALAAVGRSTAGVVHELNNSLQVMLGYATLGRDAVAGELATHLQRIEHEARRSTEIVSSVLQMSRSPEAVVLSEVVLSEVDLREVADEVASALRVLQPPDGVEISVSGNGVALATRCRCHQIISNLAKNAVHAAGAGGRVRIELSTSETVTAIAVDDTGPGVPAEIGSRIFDPFFTTKPGGTGLGLPVSRSLAAVLGGVIEVGRSDLGGARFTLRFPPQKAEKV